MADEPRPMPQITVRDPSRPDRPAELLVSGGEDRLPLDPAVTRRRLRIAGALLLVGLLAAGAVEWREQRAQAAEERRLGAIVELRAEHQGGSSSFDPSSGTGRLTLDVQLYNDGPREVSITAAAVAGYELLAQSVQVAAGGSTTVAMQRTVTCDGSAPPTSPSGDLRLAVRTITGERPVEIPLPVDENEALRLCGFRPLETMNVSFADYARPVPEVVDLVLHLQSQAIEPVHLVAVVPAPGIAVQLRLQGRPRGLPLELVSNDGLTRTLSVWLRLSVSDCEAALAPSGPDLPTPDSRSLLVQMRDARGDTGDFEVNYPAGLLDSLVGESC